MKVLYHHRIRSKDGQYVHIEEMVNALRMLGHEVTVVGPSAIERETFGADAGLVALLKKSLPAFVYELLELAYALVAYQRLARAVRRHRPDCLYERYTLFCPAGVWVKRKYRLPMLLEVNAPLYEERRKYSGIALNRLARWSQRYTWNGADYVLPVTRVLADIVRHSGVPEHRIVVAHNGINPDRFRTVSDTETAKQTLGLSGRVVLGFTGFVREWHEVERVIDLIADTRDQPLHLLIVGDGPARRELEQRAAQRNVRDRVTITGIIDRENVAKYVAAFDLALHPAVVEYASPLKLFEYLAMGRTIIAPAQPNMLEILTDNRNALLFDPSDKDGLVKAIRRASADPSLRARMAEGARLTIPALGLTWLNNAARVVQLFSRLGVGDPETLPPMARARAAL